MVKEYSWERMAKYRRLTRHQLTTYHISFGNWTNQKTPTMSQLLYHFFLSKQEDKFEEKKLNFIFGWYLVSRHEETGKTKPTLHLEIRTDAKCREQHIWSQRIRTLYTIPISNRPVNFATIADHHYFSLFCFYWLWNHSDEFYFHFSSTKSDQYRFSFFWLDFHYWQ